MNVSLLWGRARFVAAPASPAPVVLRPRQLWSGTLKAGAKVEVRRGVVWLTQSGAAADYILRAGQSFTASRRGRVVVQALEPSLLCVQGIAEQA
jgi:hypothetical protein